MFAMAITAMLMSVNFTACDTTDDDNTKDLNLKGRWYAKTDSVSNLMIVNEDNSVVTYKASNYQSWENIKGNLAIEGNEIVIYLEDGNKIFGQLRHNRQYTHHQHGKWRIQILKIGRRDQFDRRMELLEHHIQRKCKS